MQLLLGKTILSGPPEDLPTFRVTRRGPPDDLEGASNMGSVHTNKLKLFHLLAHF